MAPNFAANFQPYHDNYQTMNNDANSGGYHNATGATGTANYVGYYYFDDPSYTRYISDMTVDIDFDTSGVTGQISGAIKQDGKVYTGTATMAGATMGSASGGTIHFFNGATLTGSMTSGADTLSFSSTPLPHTTLYTDGTDNYLAGNNLGSGGGTISIDGAAAITPAQSGLVLTQQ